MHDHAAPVAERAAEPTAEPAAEPSLTNHAKRSTAFGLVGLIGKVLEVFRRLAAPSHRATRAQAAQVAAIAAALDAAQAAASRAERAAQAADEAAAAAAEWYHLGLPFRQGTGVHLSERHDILAEGLPFRHDISAGRRGGQGRAWRELDNDIETLD